MTRARILTAVGLIGCLAIGGLVLSQTAHAKKGVVLTAQDYTEITELYARLYQGSDLRETDLWLSAFSEDGVFRFPNGDEVVGKKALAEWRAKSFAGSTADSKRRHWTSGVMLTPTPDGGAQSRAYFLLIDVSGKQPVVTSSGRFDDVFVKTAGGWKFKKHAVRSDS